MTFSKRRVDQKGGTMEIKDVILTRVSERGISIAELARRSSVNYQLLRNSLHSDRLLKADELIRVSAELGLEIADYAKAS